MEPQVLISGLCDTLGLQLEDKELFCLLKVLVRENANNEGDEEPARTQPTGIVMYKDFYQLVCNYLRKTKVMLASEATGLDYAVLSKPILDFLLQLKQKMDEKSLTLTQVLQRQIKDRQISDSKGAQVQVKTIEFDDFFDELFVKLKVISTPQKN